MSEASGRRAFAVLRWGAFAGCLALFARALAKSDLHAAWGHIVGIGPLAVVALVPFGIGLAMDTWAWRTLLGGLERRVPFPMLYKIRVALEAVTNSAPLGALFADALAPVLVSRRTDVPAEDVFAACTAKRWTIARAHAAYVTIASLIGFGVLSRASEPLLKSRALLPLCFAAAAFLVLTSFAVEALAGHGRVAERVSVFLAHRRFGRVKAWIDARQERFARADVQLKRISRSRGVQLGAAVRVLGQWVIEGLETFLLLRLLGAEVGIVETFAMDAALSIVRTAAVFAPAGIGVQDVGYLAFFEALGVPNASALGPAFVVLKRVKEAIWIAIGFAVLARVGSRAELAEAKAAAD